MLDSLSLTSVQLKLKMTTRRTQFIPKTRPDIRQFTTFGNTSFTFCQALLINRKMYSVRFIITSSLLTFCLAFQADTSRLNSDEFSRRQLFERITTSSIITSASGLILPQTPSHAEDVPISSSTVPKIKLGSSNLEISRMIQGYWQLAGGHGKYKEIDAISNMEAHLAAGVTTIDTADIYGPSELIVGKFVRNNPTIAVPLTKFCCFRFLDEIDRAEVRSRIQKSCERLQVSKLPLVQFFWSNYDVPKYVDVALWLTELKEEGLIQEIGATNFDLKHLQEFKKAGVPIVSHQVQLSALDRRPVQSGMADWCAENQISLIAFGTVGSGILSKRYLGKGPPTKDDLNTPSMRMYSNTAGRFGEWKLVQELLQTMDVIAKQVHEDGRCLDCTIANVAQRYVLETSAVAAVLIGVRNQDHIAENVRSHTFTLTQGERDAIDSVVAKRKGPLGDVWDIERGYLTDMQVKKSNS
jgi:aryl-alcohol dehydrogenase-like predicted oxidoreductase